MLHATQQDKNRWTDDRHSPRQWRRPSRQSKHPRQQRTDQLSERDVAGGSLHVAASSTLSLPDKMHVVRQAVLVVSVSYNREWPSRKIAISLNNQWAVLSWALGTWEFNPVVTGISEVIQSDTHNNQQAKPSRVSKHMHTNGKFNFENNS